MLTQITDFLNIGGPALWVIAGLSVITLGLILWKLWRLSLMGAGDGDAPGEGRYG